MAWAFRGNTSTLATSGEKNLPMIVGPFTVVNKTAGAITANVYMVSGVDLYCIAPHNVSINANEMYQGDNTVVMLATEKIRVQVSGSVDFDFFIDNVKP